MYWYVKVRGKKDKRFSFLTPENGTTRLKIHAVMVEGEERAVKLAKDLMTLNEGVLAKVEPVSA